MFLQKCVPAALLCLFVSIAGVNAHEHGHKHDKKSEGSKKDTAKKDTSKEDAAIVEKQKPDYPMNTCVVSGDAFGGEMGDPIDFVHEKRLVRFCCKGCIKGFKKDPAKFLKTLDEAAAKKKDAKKDTKKDENKESKKDDKKEKKKEHKHGEGSHGHKH